MSERRSVKLFLVAGKPGGLMTEEIINCASHGVEEIQRGIAA